MRHLVLAQEMIATTMTCVTVKTRNTDDGWFQRVRFLEEHFCMGKTKSERGQIKPAYSCFSRGLRFISGVLKQSHRTLGV